MQPLKKMEVGLPCWRCSRWFLSRIPRLLISRLNCFGCHGIGGIWGGILTGVFATQQVNPVIRWNGLAFGDWHLFVAQLAAIAITIAVAIVGTLICAKLVGLVCPLRVTKRDERVGLDLSQHGERAYPSFNGLDD